MTEQEFRGPQAAAQSNAAPAVDGCGTIGLFPSAVVEPAAVRVTAAVLAEEHPAAAHNEYGSCVAPGFCVALGTDEQARVHHQLPPVDLTDPDRQSSHERWAEQRTRVAMYADTLEADGFTVDRREVPSGPILLAMPPEAYPCRIGVCCDECGHTVSHDYLVHVGMSRAQRLQVARDHLTANEGWSCTPAADLCPNCAAKTPDPGPCGKCGQDIGAHAGWALRHLHAPQEAPDDGEGELTPEETGERENSLLYWLGPRTEPDAPDAGQ
jgi:hypothetical protein